MNLLALIFPPALTYQKFTERYEVLKNKLKAGEVLRFDLVRTVPINLKGKATAGRLYINGLFMAYTIEPPDLNNVPRVSSIPSGTYRLIFSFSPKFGKLTPRLVDVPGRDGILIHAGTNAQSTQGCIVPTLNPGNYLKSHLIEADIYKLVRESTRNGSTFITVRNYSEYVRPLVMVLSLIALFLLVLITIRYFVRK